MISKRFISLISLLLVLVMSFAILLTGCDEDADTTSSTETLVVYNWEDYIDESEETSRLDAFVEYYKAVTGKDIEIRIPYIPNYNDTQIEKITHFLAPLQNVTKVRVLPYHNYAGSKYKALNLPNTLPDKLPTDEEIQKAAETIKNITNFVVLY